MNKINWQFCNDPNEINEVLLKGGDYDWEGLTDANQIINIFYFEGHRNYMVFWATEALQNLSKPNNGLQGSDLISRHDAMEAVRKVWCNNDDRNDFKQKYYEMGNNDAVEDALGEIEKLPTVVASTVASTEFLISRYDAKDKAKEIMYSILDDTDYNNIESMAHACLMMKIKILKMFDALPSAEAEQVTGKLKNHCDYLLTDDSDECKKQKSKLDLIRRQDAINAVCANCLRQDLEVFDGCLGEDCSIKPILESLPSAEPKTGKWVKVIDEDTSNVVKWHYECDQCGAGRWENDQRYCNRCGARMLGEDGE